MDQVPCDSDCLADRRLSGFDNRIRDIRLALGCVNALTGRFAAIYSTSKPDTRAIPDVHSNRSVCNESNTDSYTDTDAVTKSSIKTIPPATAIEQSKSAILDTSKFVRIAVDWLLRSDIGEVIKTIVDDEGAFPDYQIPKKPTARKKRRQ